MKIFKYIYISFFIACFISPTYYSQVHYDYLINTDGKIISAVFDDNRQNLFVATENFVIQQWDFKNAKLVQTLTGPQDIIFSMAIDSEGKFLACGGREQKIFVWDIESGSLIREISTNSRSISSLVFTKNSDEIITGSYDNTVRKWNLKNGIELSSVNLGSPINKIELNRTNQNIICGLFDGNIKILNPELLLIREFKAGNYLSTFSLSDNGQEIITSTCETGTSLSTCKLNTIKLWAITSSNLLSRVDIEENPIKNIFFSSALNKIIALDNTGKVLSFKLINNIIIKDSEIRNEINNLSLLFSTSDRSTVFGINHNGKITPLSQNKEELIKYLVEVKINDWQKKGKFEKSDDYINRVNLETRNAKVQEFVAETINELARNSVGINFNTAKNDYDADNEVFKIIFTNLTPIYLKVPIEEAQEFDTKFNLLVSKNAQFVLKDDENFALVYLKIVNPGNNKEYLYDSRNELSFFTSNLKLNFEEIDINLSSKNVTSSVQESVRNIDVGRADVDVNLPYSKNSNPDAIAIVIGNRDYQKTSKVDYALNDARSIKEYLLGVMGFKEGNIIYEENATKGIFEIIFGSKDNKRGKLSNYVKQDISDVFIYYSGHGAPDLKNQRGYFVPIEADPNYIDISGYSLDLFYSNISHIPAKSITVVLDACFSGANVYKNISPVTITMDSPELVDPRIIVMSSSSGTEVSSWFEENQHGLFTYYFLKAIHNKNADKNNDNKLTIAEIYEYLTNSQDGVNYNARRKGIEQNPTLTGNEINRVLIEW